MKKINFNYIMLLILWFSLFKLCVLPIMIQKVVKFILILVCIIYIIKNFKQLRNVNKYIFIYIAWIIITGLLGYFSSNLSFNTLGNCIIYGMNLLTSYLIININMNDNRKNEILNSLYFFSIIVNIGSIFMIIKNGGSSTTSIDYFIGGKFYTSYFLVLYFVLLLYKKFIDNDERNIKNGKKNVLNRLLILLQFLIIVYLINYIKCSTALVGFTLIIFFIILKNHIKFLFKPNIVLFVVLLLGYAPFLIETILQNDYISYFISNVLGETLTLSGRLKIYSYLNNIIMQKPYFGYGYGNEIVSQVVGYGNAQNGFLDLCVSYGLIGGLFFLLSIIKSFKRSIKTDDLNLIIKILIYFFIICSAIEISYNIIFFVFLFIISDYYVYEKEMK